MHACLLKQKTLCALIAITFFQLHPNEIRKRLIECRRNANHQVPNSTEILGNPHHWDAQAPDLALLACNNVRVGRAWRWVWNLVRINFTWRWVWHKIDYLAIFVWISRAIYHLATAQAAKGPGADSISWSCPLDSARVCHAFFPRIATRLHEQLGITPETRVAPAVHKRLRCWANILIVGCSYEHTLHLSIYIYIYMCVCVFCALDKFIYCLILFILVNSVPHCLSYTHVLCCTMHTWVPVFFRKPLWRHCRKATT